MAINKARVYCIYRFRKKFVTSENISCDRHKDKKCVRLIKGKFDDKTVYGSSPIEQAKKYYDHGFKNLHIVDLDGALTGKTVNIDLIKDIANNFDFKIEVGGGIRTIDSIKEYIDVGIEKVILGSAAIKNKKVLKRGLWPI